MAGATNPPRPTVASVYTGCPGLAIHLTTSGNPRWTVTHLASGLSAGEVDHERQAKAAVVALAGAGVDWTLEQDRLAQTSVKLARRIRVALDTGRCPQFRQQNLFPKYKQVS